MAEQLSQQEKAKRFHQLHHTDTLLVLPNIWDPLGALLLESLGYPAVATASASVAFTNGFNDGEKIPFRHMLEILNRIAASVDVPVTADVESGFAGDDETLSENIQRLLQTEIV